MFQFEGFCEDKAVPKVLRALAAIAGVYEVPAPRPIPDAIAKGGKVVSGKIDGLGTGASLVLKAANGHPTITTAQAQAALKRGSMSAASASAVIQELIKAKALKRKSRGVYEVSK